MTSRGTNRQLLEHIGVEIPEGAASFHTERTKPNPAEIVFSVQHSQGASVKRIALTDSQRDWLYQQQRYGSLGWNLDDE